MSPCSSSSFTFLYLTTCAIPHWANIWNPLTFVTIALRHSLSLMRIVGLAGSDLLWVFILGAFRTVAEENFKRFHVSVHLCVCVCGWVCLTLWNSRASVSAGFGPTTAKFWTHLPQYLSGTQKLFLGLWWHNGSSQTCTHPPTYVTPGGKNRLSIHPRRPVGRGAAAVLEHVKACCTMLHWRDCFFVPPVERMGHHTKHDNPQQSKTNYSLDFTISHIITRGSGGYRHTQFFKNQLAPLISNPPTPACDWNQLASLWRGNYK